MNEPANTPNFAWFNKSAPILGIPAKERFAIKRATVKPIPPNIDTPNRPKHTANGIPGNEPIPISPKVTPALTKAKSGRIR